MERTGEGRAINRHDYRLDEIDAALKRPVVRRLLELIRLRNTHPAFDGELDVEADDPHLLRLRWRAGDTSLRLEIDVRPPRQIPAVVEEDPSAPMSKSADST